MTSVSQRALAASTRPAEMPEHERAISEQYRLVAKEWVTLDGAARLLEETKSAVLAQKMKALGDRPSSHAERDVKASAEWSDFIKKMVDARTAANLKKVHLEYIRMLASERQSVEANQRHEARLTR